MTEIWEQYEQKVDFSGIDTYPDYSLKRIEYNIEGKKLHRDVLWNEIEKSFSPPKSEAGGADMGSHLAEHLGEVKTKYLVFDLKYLYGLGYRDVYYKDLAPGNTQISYELRVGDA